MNVGGLLLLINRVDTRLRKTSLGSSVHMGFEEEEEKRT